VYGLDPGRALDPDCGHVEAGEPLQAARHVEVFALDAGDHAGPPAARSGASTDGGHLSMGRAAIEQSGNSARQSGKFTPAAGSGVNQSLSQRNASANLAMRKPHDSSIVVTDETTS